MEGDIFYMAHKRSEVFCHNLHRISVVFITDNFSLMYRIKIFFMESALCDITLQSVI
jgi:hypothetical protein